jgi:hypothetical protein
MHAGMRTVELLEEALQSARALGFRIREDWLGDAGGGACVLKGQKWLMLDPALDVAERLALVVEAVANDPAAAQLNVSGPLRGLLGVRKSA